MEGTVGILFKPNGDAKSHSNRISKIIIRDSESFITSSYDGTVRIWKEGKEEHESYEASKGRSFKKDGFQYSFAEWVTDITLIENHIAAISVNGLAKLLNDFEEKETVVKLSNDRLWSIDSYKGSLVVGGNEGLYKLRDLENWTSIDEWSIVKSPEENGGIMSLLTVNEFSTISGSSYGSVESWDWRTSASSKIGHHKLGHPVRALLAWSEFEIISAGFDRSIKIWDSRKPLCEVNSFNEHYQPITALAKKGNRLLSAGKDGLILGFTNPLIKRNDSDSEEPLLLVAQKTQCTALAVSIGSDFIIGGDIEGSVFIWEEKNKRKGPLRGCCSLRQKIKAVEERIVRATLAPLTQHALVEKSNGEFEVIDIVRLKRLFKFSRSCSFKKLQEIFSKQPSVPEWASVDCRLGVLRISVPDFSSAPSLPEEIFLRSSPLSEVAGPLLHLEKPKSKVHLGISLLETVSKKAKTNNTIQIFINGGDIVKDISFLLQKEMAIKPPPSISVHVVPVRKRRNEAPELKRPLFRVDLFCTAGLLLALIEKKLKSEGHLTILKSQKLKLVEFSNEFEVLLSRFTESQKTKNAALLIRYDFLS